MIFKDQQMLAEAYKLVSEKSNTCECGKNCKCKDKNVKKSSGKPDYLDIDKDGDKKEPMKKAIKEESMSSFKALFNKIIVEKERKAEFGPEPKNPHLEADRKKLEELRKKRQEKSKTKKK